MVLEKDATRKWRNLRDKFAKEWKKIRKSRASDASDDGQYTGRWEYFTNLEFLKGIAAKSTEGNIFHNEVLVEWQISLVILKIFKIKSLYKKILFIINACFSSAVSLLTFHK